ncbi:MAG: PQQ-binding-like beta-propeller repeat protein [Planctomycetaceae bacterium]|nr:PQQ-binding-like beta-propeller repeat protein [Planctomycetaceae bacterium]
MQRLSLLLIVLMTPSVAGAADWRQFRGTSGEGLADAAAPTDWSDGAPIAWSAELPGRGLASPIVVDGQVIVSSSSGPAQQRLHVASFDAATGQQQWDRQFWATGRTACHPTTCVAAPTPASDGARIFAFYSTNDVVCLDLSGNLLWFRGLTHDYPNASNSLGMASSPVVVGDTVIVMVESDADSFAAGLNVETGETRWRLERPRKSNWTSPVVMTDETSGRSTVLLQSADGVCAIDPHSGEQVWNYPDGASTIPSSVIVGEMVFVPSNGVTALRAGRSNPGVPEVVWNEGGLQPGTASLAATDSRLYLVNSGGVLTCANLENGSRLWQLRLQGKFSGSPVIAGGHLFIFNQEGTGFCVQLGDDKGAIVGTHEFGESFLSTPAIADGAVYVRTDGHLWKIAQP